jgi:hypothetical protein
LTAIHLDCVRVADGLVDRILAAQPNRDLKLMPKRGTDADSRIFFDGLPSLGVLRLRASGAIKLEDGQVIVPFGGKNKLIGVAHTIFTNG